MTQIGASIGLGALLSWLFAALFALVFSPELSVAFGLALGFALAFAAQRTTVIGALIALLAPFGVALPALALAGLAGQLGLKLPGFATWELALFLVAYTAFLAAAFGVIRVDVYRYGYAPLPVGAMVLALCAYGLLTQNWLIPALAVGGQCFWALGWGSSNWFDHILHVLMWPVALVTVIARLVF